MWWRDELLITVIRWNRPLDASLLGKRNFFLRFWRRLLPGVNVFRNRDLLLLDLWRTSVVIALARPLRASVGIALARLGFRNGNGCRLLLVWIRWDWYLLRLILVTRSLSRWSV